MHFDFKARTDYINDVEKFEYSFKGTFNPKLAAARNEDYDVRNIYNSPLPNSSLYLYHYKINDSIFYQLKNGLYEFYAKNYDKSRKDYHSGLRNKLLISANNKLLIAYLKYDLELLKNFFEKHNLEKDNINTFSPKEIELEGPRMNFVVDEVTGENYQNGNAIFKKKFYDPPHSYYIKKSYDSLIENLNTTIKYIQTNLSHLDYMVKPPNKIVGFDTRLNTCKIDDLKPVYDILYNGGRGLIVKGNLEDFYNIFTNREVENTILWRYRKQNHLVHFLKMLNISASPIYNNTEYRVSAIDYFLIQIKKDALVGKKLTIEAFDGSHHAPADATIIQKAAKKLINIS